MQAQCIFGGQYALTILAVTNVQDFPHFLCSLQNPYPFTTHDHLPIPPPSLVLIASSNNIKMNQAYISHKVPSFLQSTVWPVAHEIGSESYGNVYVFRNTINA